MGEHILPPGVVSTQYNFYLQLYLTWMKVICRLLCALQALRYGGVEK
jgi:hypothetical protein